MLLFIVHKKLLSVHCNFSFSGLFTVFIGLFIKLSLNVLFAWLGAIHVIRLSPIRPTPTKTVKWSLNVLFGWLGDINVIRMSPIIPSPMKTVKSSLNAGSFSCHQAESHYTDSYKDCQIESQCSLCLAWSISCHQAESHQTESHESQ